MSTEKGPFPGRHSLEGRTGEERGRILNINCLFFWGLYYYRARYYNPEI
jgi:hypothetical protein